MLLNIYDNIVSNNFLILSVDVLMWEFAKEPQLDIADWGWLACFSANFVRSIPSIINDFFVAQGAVSKQLDNESFEQEKSDANGE